MIRHKIEPLHVGALTGEVIEHDQTLSVVLRGDSDAREASAVLDEFLVRRVHPAVLRSGYKSVVLDVTGLEFLNSSGIKALVNWLQAIKEQQPQSRYSVVIQYDQGITWQVKGLKPLTNLASGFLRLESLR
ncbi:MAG: STAS domain-containing protein [Polyangia bacterium]